MADELVDETPFTMQDVKTAMDRTTSQLNELQEALNQITWQTDAMHAVVKQDERLRQEADGLQQSLVNIQQAMEQLETASNAEIGRLTSLLQSPPSSEETVALKSEIRRLEDYVKLLEKMIL